jgi:hypothetical protein
MSKRKVVIMRNGSENEKSREDEENKKQKRAKPK